MAIRQECGRCWIASGTPAPNSPSDYEHQLSVLSGYPVGLHLSGDRKQDALVVVHELERGFYYLQARKPQKDAGGRNADLRRPFDSSKVRV